MNKVEMNIYYAYWQLVMHALALVYPCLYDQLIMEKLMRISIIAKFYKCSTGGEKSL